MLKRLIQSALFLGALMFSGCGNGDVTGNSDNTEVIDAGNLYTLSSGDTIRENEDNTTINITHTIETGVKTVEVLSGSIKIIKGNY